MPVYDFKCEKCGKQLETVLKITHTDSDKPVCCETAMVKQPSAFSAHFKGAGFHSVDYRAPTRGY